jgi:hypothetical protein
VRENRQLAQPAVLDNYVTSGLQEDHLSMGTNAALKLHRALENCTQILAIEYLLAAQALSFSKSSASARAPMRRGACCVSGSGLRSGPLAGTGYRRCRQRSEDPDCCTTLPNLN